MVECSEFSKLLTQLAMNIGADPRVHNLNDVLREIQKDHPGMRREVLVEAIAETSKRQARDSDELSKKLLGLKQEARLEKKYKKLITELNTYLETGQLPGVKKRQSHSPEAVAKLAAAG